MGGEGGAVLQLIHKGRVGHQRDGTTVAQRSASEPGREKIAGSSHIIVATQVDDTRVTGVPPAAPAGDLLRPDPTGMAESVPANAASAKS